MEIKRGRGRPHGTAAPKSDAVFRVRNRIGMTQKEFAHELNCSISTIRRYEQQAVMPGGIAQKRALAELAKRLGMVIDNIERADNVDRDGQQ